MNVRRLSRSRCLSRCRSTRGHNNGERARLKAIGTRWEVFGRPFRLAENDFTEDNDIVLSREVLDDPERSNQLDIVRMPTAALRLPNSLDEAAIGENLGTKSASPGDRRVTGDTGVGGEFGVVVNWVSLRRCLLLSRDFLAH